MCECMFTLMANVHRRDLCTYAFCLMYVPVSSLYDCVFNLSVVTFSVLFVHTVKPLNKGHFWDQPFCPL